MDAATLPTEYLGQPASVIRGFREYILGDQPAAGASFQYNLEGRYITRPLSIRARLVADANAANREVVCEYRDDQSRTFVVSGAAVTWPASTTVDYDFDIFQPLTEWPVDSSVLVPLKPLFLPPGWSIRVRVVGIQATDQLSNIRMMLERFWTDEAH